MVINVNMPGAQRYPFVRFGGEMAQSEGGVPPSALLDDENLICPLRGITPRAGCNADRAVMNDRIQWVRWMAGMGWLAALVRKLPTARDGGEITPRLPRIVNLTLSCSQPPLGRVRESVPNQLH